MEPQNKYRESFAKLIENFPDDYYIGIGNPDAKILIVGKEGATEHIPENETSLAGQWRRAAGLPAFRFRNPDGRPFRIGDTYTKYQKLHDYIFGEDNRAKGNAEVDFFKNFFTTELNVNRAARSKDAAKDGMQQRKEEFFGNTEFIRQFPVTVLACGPYICQKEIETLFKVVFDKKYPDDDTPNPQAFWAHYNPDRTKLVIHTRQLSSNVTDTLLKTMAGVIREFLRENKL